MDITEQSRAEEALEESEKKFAKAFHGTVAAKALTRLSDGRFIEVNDRWAKIVGMEADEIIGRTAAEVIWTGPEQRKDFVREIIRTDRSMIRNTSSEERTVRCGPAWYHPRS